MRRVQPTDVEVPGPDEPALLTDRDDELDGGVLDLGVIAQQPHQLEAPGDAGLVVGTEDRRAVGADDAVLADDRHDPAIGARRVHVGGHQDRALTRAGVRRNDVADLVGVRAAAEPTEPTLHETPDLLLVARRAVDGHEVEKGLQQPVAIDRRREHGPPRSLGHASRRPTIGPGSSVTTTLNLREPPARHLRPHSPAAGDRPPTEAPHPSRRPSKRERTAGVLRTRSRARSAAPGRSRFRRASAHRLPAPRPRARRRRSSSPSRSR